MIGIPLGQQAVTHLGLVRAADKPPPDGIITDAVQHLVVVKIRHLDGAKDLHDPVHLAPLTGLGDRQLRPIGRVGAELSRSQR
jgi:hypothetical protein